MTEFHWFLSFRDPDRNVNLGGCMVVVDDTDPPDAGKAADLAWKLGCNPGGEVMAYTAEGSDPAVAQAIRAMPHGILLTRENIAVMWEPYGIRVGRPS